jgi:hypothetical protein
LGDGFSACLVKYLKDAPQSQPASSEGITSDQVAGAARILTHLELPVGKRLTAASRCF